jgi:hypothetical protein
MHASELMAAPATAVTARSALAWDLARAWTRLLDDTLRAFPSPAQRLTSRGPQTAAPRRYFFNLVN